MNKFLFLEEKNHENPPLPSVFFKYILKSSAGMRYAWLTDYSPIQACSMLPKLPIITKIASNKSYSELNFL